MKRAFIAVTAILLALVAACGGDSPDGESGSATFSEVASQLVDAASGDQAQAVSGLLIATDRGYSLQQIVDAARSGSFVANAGAITLSDGYVEPHNAPGGYVTNAPKLTSAGALAPSGFSAKGTIDDVYEVSSGFLLTPPEVFLDVMNAGSSGDAPASAPEQGPADLENFHVILTLALVDAGYSADQIIEALILGDTLRCVSDNPSDCRLEGIEPKLSPINILDRDLTEPEAAEDQPESAGGRWTGVIAYSDDTVEFEPGTSEVEVVRDNDGEFFMTATLTYRTVGGTCQFDWKKTFSGVGELDESSRIAFEGTETVVSTSSCAGANTQDLANDTTVIVTVDGDDLSGVLLGGELTASGTFVG